jgi:IS605 OrfB family transposase
LSPKTGKVNGIKYRELFLNHLNTGSAYQVEMLRKNGKYYCHITFELPKVAVVYTGHRAMIGIDTNPDGFALTMIDNSGNHQAHCYLKQPELSYAKTNRRTNLCGELVKQVIVKAQEHNCGIAFEDLKFKNDRDVSRKFARIKNQFVYAKLLTMLQATCEREGIEYTKVHPAYTSKIGLYKYCHQYGMVIHNGAAMVIARRSYGFKESVPNILKEKFATEKYQDKFDSYHEWKKWSMINSNLIKKRKEVKKPDFWLANRKELLGLKLSIEL